MRLLAGVLMVWFAAAVCVVAAGVLGRLPVPPPAIVAVLSLATIVAVASSRARQWVMSVDLVRLLAVHVVRFVGIAFLLLVQRGALSPAFVPIGWGDAISAAGAVVLILMRPALSRRRDWWAVLAWNVFGFADMVMLVVTGIRLGAAAPEQFALFRSLPFGLLPTFFVPLIISTHVFIFARLIAQRREERTMDLPQRLEWIEEAFGTGAVVTPEGRVPCFVRHAGDLFVSTGRIVACDPLVFPDAEPFTVTVPPGTYPVTLAVAQVNDVDQRVAYARLQFAAEAPATWQMAVIPGQELAALRPDEIYGYPVDAGTGCFMDAAAAALLRERMTGEDEYYETINEAMERTYVHTWSHADVRPSPQHDHNCIVFSSGWGDGFYTSYFGYSAAGEVVCLVTDFDIL